MSGGPQYRERLQYQLRYFVNRAMFPTREEADAAIKRAKAHFIKTGHSIKGVKIEARWRNPDNRNSKHANWKDTTDRGQSLYGFWRTIARKVL